MTEIRRGLKRDRLADKRDTKIAEGRNTPPGDSFSLFTTEDLLPTRNGLQRSFRTTLYLATREGSLQYYRDRFIKSTNNYFDVKFVYVEQDGHKSHPRNKNLITIKNKNVSSSKGAPEKFILLNFIAKTTYNYWNHELITKPVLTRIVCIRIGDTWIAATTTNIHT